MKVDFTFKKEIVEEISNIFCRINLFSVYIMIICYLLFWGHL